ncbi:MAG: hypothetical protein AB7O39_01070 [Flavobacteriaceae bacterium]
MNWDTLQQFLRIVMQVVSGVLISKGLLSEEMSVTLTGGVLSLANVAWWIFWNRRAAPATV